MHAASERMHIGMPDRLAGTEETAMGLEARKSYVGGDREQELGA